MQRFEIFLFNSLFEVPRRNNLFLKKHLIQVMLLSVNNYFYTTTNMYMSEVTTTFSNLRIRIWEALNFKHSSNYKFEVRKRLL